MNLLILLAIVLVLVFSFVIFIGAPYLPTLKKQTKNAFELLNLRPGQMILELGSGDGRILRYAAQHGIKGVGYEINPLLVWFSRLRNWRYRKLIRFECKNYWNVTLPECDAIYTFLLDKYMAKLDTKITAEIHHPVKLVTYAFKIPNKRIKKEKDGVFLYEYRG